MSSFIASAILSTLVVPSLPSPEGIGLPTGARGAETPIFEWSDYAGEKSTARARISYEGARNWCENWRPGEEAELKICADEMFEAERDVIHEATANCKTGEITASWGESYTFAGIDRTDRYFNGWLTFKDQYGNLLPLNYASGALDVAAQWITLCPFGQPYDIVPLKLVMEQDDLSWLGGLIGFDGRMLRQDDEYGLITYSEQEDLGIEQGTVLFRGHWIRGGSIDGIVFSFKKGCDPAGYRVYGYDHANSDEVTLEGAAPIWGDACEIEGYSREAPGGRLVFYLPHH